MGSSLKKAQNTRFGPRGYAQPIEKTGVISDMGRIAVPRKLDSISLYTSEVLFWQTSQLTPKLGDSIRLCGMNHQLTLVAFLSLAGLGRLRGNIHQLTLVALSLSRKRRKAISVS